MRESVCVSVFASVCVRACVCACCVGARARTTTSINRTDTRAHAISLQVPISGACASM